MSFDSVFFRRHIKNWVQHAHVSDEMRNYPGEMVRKYRPDLLERRKRADPAEAFPHCCQSNIHVWVFSAFLMFIVTPTTGDWSRAVIGAYRNGCKHD